MAENERTHVCGKCGVETDTAERPVLLPPEGLSEEQESAIVEEVMESLPEEKRRAWERAKQENKD